MREQLANYVNLLFAGTTGTEEIKQEILFNTLDRYDDLIAQGKTPEAAYRLAMTGIGDIDEILAQERPVEPQPKAEPFTYSEPAAQPDPDEKEKKVRRAAAIAMYICCPVPLFILGDVLGLCLMLVLIAAATALLVMNGDKDE